MKDFHSAEGIRHARCVPSFVGVAPIMGGLLMLAAGASNAEVIDVTFTIEPTRKVSSTFYLDRTESFIEELAGAQAFQFVYRFDSAVPRKSEFIRDASSVFALAEFEMSPNGQDSPYTQELQALLPPLETAASFRSWATYAGYLVLGTPPESPQAPNTNVAFTEKYSGPSGGWWYQRSIGARYFGPPVSPDDLVPSAGGDVVAWFQDQVGSETLYFSESVMIAALGQEQPEGGPVPLYRTVEISGNVVLSSVAAVPEPATVALQGVGLLCLGWAVARRRRGARYGTR